MHEAAPDVPLHGVTETHYPLDHILGTTASVRVLRELCADGGEHAPPHIAMRTKLSRPAVREALLRLEGAQIVERVGQGRNVLYRVAKGHPLAKRIAKLFRNERKVVSPFPDR